MRLLQPTKAETSQITLGLFKKEAGFFATDIYYPDALHDSNGKGGWVFVLPPTSIFLHARAELLV